MDDIDKTDDKLAAKRIKYYEAVSVYDKAEKEYRQLLSSSLGKDGIKGNTTEAKHGIRYEMGLIFYNYWYLYAMFAAGMAWGMLAMWLDMRG